MSGDNCTRSVPVRSFTRAGRFLFARFSWSWYTRSMDPLYLVHNAFLEPHEGPPVLDRYGHDRGDRDPSPEQIRRMAAVIRATWTEADVIRALGRTQAVDQWHRRHRMSESTHTPHGISSRAIGSRDGDLEIYGAPIGGGDV